MELRECPAMEAAAAVNRCLRGRHVLLMGDSVSRYLYLSLAQFLHQGTWASDFFPPSEHEGYYGSWSEFFDVTHGRLGGLAPGRLGGRAVCDCFRKDYSHKWVLNDGMRDVETVGSLENRYFVAPGGGRLTFLQMFGSNPVVWHDPVALGALPCGASEGCVQGLCAPADCSPFNTSGVRVGALGGPAMRSLAAQLLPTDIVVNSGLWESWEKGGEGDGPLTERLSAIEQLAEAVACARDAALCGSPFSVLRAAAAAPRLYWRTTTAPAPVSLRSFREPRLVAEVLRRGWRVVDAGGVGAALRKLISIEGLEVWSDARGTGGWILHNETPDACATGKEAACPPLQARLERERGVPDLDPRHLWADEVHPAPVVTQQLSKFLAAHLCAS